ncbi:MAG: hypothetical protein Q4A63_01185 [Butyricicoccus pullicaecorum]|nr:hypothetical protein [Butyricicoccus pullicaecorum]MDO4668409.1 hypothetical protein [Butyricicoccus pullicaecorum]
MYNEYLEDMDQTAISPNISTPEKTTAAIHGGGLGQLLSGKLGNLKLDMDTLIAFAVIWFLLSDGNIVDTDLLIIIGILLLLGV